MVDARDNPPLAFGANCGTGASDILRTVLGFVAQGTERPIIAKGNAGIPKYVDGQIPDSYTHLRAHETLLELVCRLLLEKKKTHTKKKNLHINNLNIPQRQAQRTSSQKTA